MTPSLRMFRLRPAVTCLIMLALTGCGSSHPSGQTVATVDGTAITRSELDFELAALGLQRADAAQRARVLKDLIDRRLFAAAAEANGFDKQPDYILARQRADSILLAQREAQSVASQLQQPPSDDEIDLYLQKHPELGTQRQLLQVDQIRFPAPTGYLKDQIEATKSMADLATVLSQQGITFERGSTEIDTIGLDVQSRNRIIATKTGEPLIVLNGPSAIANHITGIRPIEVSAAMTSDLVRQRILAERVTTGLRHRQEALQKTAKIKYAKGYAPQR